MKKRSAELKAKIAARDTEIQRWYDLADSQLKELHNRKQRLVNELSSLEDDIDSMDSYIRKIYNRAEELECLDILL